MKISTEDFTDETLAIDDTYGDDVWEIVVLVMEVDKVANEVTDIEVDKVTNMWNFVRIVEMFWCILMMRRRKELNSLFVCNHASFASKSRPISFGTWHTGYLNFIVHT